MNRFVWILALGIWSTTTVAQSAPVPATFVVDPSTSLTVAVSLNGSPLGTGPLVPTGGGLTSTVNQTGIGPPPLDMSNINGGFTVQDFAIGTLLTVTNAALTIGPGAGPYLTGNDNATIDLGGLPLTISSGVVTALGSAVADFSTTPATFTLPAGTIASFSESGGPGVYTLALSIPVNVTGTADIDLFGSPATIGYDVNGTLVLTGVTAVPEPATWALACLGLIGVAPALRRYRRKM